MPREHPSRQFSAARGEIAAHEIQDSITARKRAVGIPDDASVHQLLAEEKLRDNVAGFLGNLTDNMRWAAEEPDLTCKWPLRVDIGNIPFSEWRARPSNWLKAAAAFSLPILGWYAWLCTTGDAGYFNPGPQPNGSLKCIFFKPVPSSTQSPALQRFFAEIREHGCEPVATVSGMELSLTFKLRAS